METQQDVESGYHQSIPAPHLDYLFHARVGDGQRTGKQGQRGYRIEPAAQQFRGHVYGCAKCGHYFHGAERVRRSMAIHAADEAQHGCQ